MLEDAQKSLPDELSNRFSLNRFLAFQRDIINDELASNVPDLIEDALENPTGTYQQVTRFQNEKLMDIDRSTIEIKRSLDDIFALLQKVSAQSGGGGGILDDILSALGLGSLFGGGKDRKKNRKKRNAGGGSGSGNQNNKKKKSFLERIFGDKKSSGTGGRSGRGGFGRGPVGFITRLLGAGAGSALFLDLVSEDVDLKEMFNNLLGGEYNEELKDAAAIATISAAPSAISSGKDAIKNIFKGPSAGSLDAPAAVGPSSGVPPTADRVRQPRRYDLDPTDPNYRPRGTPGAGQYVSPQLLNPVPSEDVPKPKFFDKVKSVVSSSVGKAFDYTKGVAKGSAYAATAYALYDFYGAITSLPPNLTENEYRKEVSRLARETIAITGLTTFGGFVGGLVGGSAGSFAFGVGSIPGAVVGIVGGVIGGGVANYLYADEAGNIVNSPEVTKLVDQLVDWMMEGIEAAKSTSDSISKALTVNQKISQLTSKDEYANLSPEQLAAKGLQRMPQVRTGRGGASQYTNYEVVDEQKYKASKTANSSGTSAFTGMPQVSAPMTGTGTAETYYPKLTKDEAAVVLSKMPDISDEPSIMEMAKKLYPNKDYGILKRIIEQYKKENNIIDDQSSLQTSGSYLAARQMQKDIVGPSRVQMGPSYAALSSATMTDAMQSYIAPPFAFPQADRRLKANSGEIDPSKNIAEMLKQGFASFSDQFLGKKNLMSGPSATTAGFPKFSSIPIPASMAISALRGNGLADVYAHPLSGPTMERMDRGGETHFG